MRDTFPRVVFSGMALIIYQFVFGQAVLPQLFINEFMASNSSTIESRDFYEYSDWIEIHNAEDTTIDLGGYYLTDDLHDTFKWQIPANTKIGAGKRKLFWADDHNQGLHLNFKLSASGEAIGLFSPKGAVIDSLSYTEQITDRSFGRSPDGGDNWFFFDRPTPGTRNIYSGYVDMAPLPVFSHSGGPYTGALSIELSGTHPEDTIRYTLDGSPPDKESQIYASPITLEETKVIRARLYREDHMPGDILTQSYFLNETTTLPLVSVATDPDNLWDDQIGIYVEGTNGKTGYCVSEPRNWNQPWERAINLEMYESNGDVAFNVGAGMQIGGGCTRKYPQKTLAIYFRSKYGTSRVNYPIFPDKDIDSYNNINLRNGGQDWWRAMFRDGLMHAIVKDRMDIDWQAYKPAVMFLNGEYWGIHGIREKHNEHYLASNHGVDPDAVDILSGSGNVKHGSSELYDNMIDYIEAYDLANDDHYDWVASQMDINEYMNYIISEIFFANIDWPGGNIKFWRPHGEGNKWRWILYDTDLGFGAHYRGQYDSNTLENATTAVGTYYANPSWSTFLLRSLLKNAGFREHFIQRFASHMNMTFDSSRVLGLIDSLKSNIEADMPRHIEKWPKSTSFNEGWDYHINVMNEFARLRPGYVIEHLTEKFDLADTVRLHVSSNDLSMGNIYLSGVRIPEKDYEGFYFKNVTLECRAVPKPGCEFIGWQGDVQSPDENIEIVLSSESTLHAIFRFDRSIVYRGLRINEILASNTRSMSDERGDFDDWIELYNHSLDPLDIGGMYVSDELGEPMKWQIPDRDPEKTTIPPGGYLLLWADKEPDEGILHLDLKLSADGEMVTLGKDTESGFVFIDTLSFGAQTADVSYGRSPNGSDELDYFTFPTPGMSNVVESSIINGTEHPETFALAQNFPNPFNPSTTIRFELPFDSPVDLTVYDISGRKLQTLVKGYRNRGYHEVRWDASSYSSGIYVYRLTAGRHTETRKMILMK